MRRLRSGSPLKISWGLRSPRCLLMQEYPIDRGTPTIKGSDSTDHSKCARGVFIGNQDRRTEKESDSGDDRADRK